MGANQHTGRGLDRRVSIRLTSDELERLEAIAKDGGKSVSAAAREAIVGWIETREAGQ